MKIGFVPIKNLNKVEYSKYFIVPGVWLNGENTKPTKCWATFSPDKNYLGCYIKFLDAKERVKIHKISKYLTNK
jgi:hypothetical protein